jgi:D-alanine-D-alanine ligase
VRARRVAIAHNAVEEDDDPSTRDVLAQVGLVRAALEGLGIAHEVIAVGEGGVDPEAINGAAAVFNLVESPPGRPAFQVEAAEVFERLGLPLTGSSAAVISVTTDKAATRERLQRAGVAVAAGGVLDPAHPELLDRVPPPWILKPALEDASLGLDDGAVTSDPATALARARELARRFPGQPLLVEHLLPGREFNIAMLAGPNGPEVLPPAEMTFVDFPADRPRILGWEAKWVESSFAYRHTVRQFLDASEERLAKELAAIAAAAWRACGVAGYARVDVRADEDGIPCVLEVNANPCLSPDAGFAAATARAGLSPDQVVARILDAAGWRA